MTTPDPELNLDKPLIPSQDVIPPAEDDAAEAPEGWEQRAKDAEGQVKSLNDRLSAQGRRQDRVQEAESLALGTNNEVRLLNRRLDALIESVSNGSTDRLPTQMAEIASQAASSQAELEYNDVWTELSQELQEVVLDEDGNAVLDLLNAPELEQVRSTWQVAHGRKDANGLARAVGEAQKVMRRAERESVKTRATANARQQAQVDNEAAGNLDLSTGPSSGGSGGMSDTRWLHDVYGNQDYSATPEDHKRAKVILDKLKA